MLQTRSSSRPRSFVRDRDGLVYLTFAIAELGSHSRRVDGLDHRDRGAWLAIAKVFLFVHRDRDPKWSAIAKSKVLPVIFSKHENYPIFTISNILSSDFWGF